MQYCNKYMITTYIAYHNNSIPKILRSKDITLPMHAT